MVGRVSVPGFRSLPLLVAAALGPLNNSQCRMEDDYFLGSFHTWLLLALVICVMIYVVLIFVPSWLTAGPYRRVAISGSFLLLCAGYFLGGSWLGVSRNSDYLSSFFARPPDYSTCTQDFGAQGFLWGLGAGKAAVFQLGWMAIIYLVTLALWLTLALLATYMFSRFISPWRLRRFVSGTEG